jgi:hypothetical protein
VLVVDTPEHGSSSLDQCDPKGKYEKQSDNADLEGHLEEKVVRICLSVDCTAKTVQEITRFVSPFNLPASRKIAIVNYACELLPAVPIANEWALFYDLYHAFP